MLKRYIGRSLGATLVVINLALAGCSAATPVVEVAPTQAAAVQAEPSAAPAKPTAAPTAAAEPPAAAPDAIPAEVAVAGARVLRNALGQAIIAGTVVNGTDAPVGGIELEIRASDAAGETLVKDVWGSEPAESATFVPLSSALGPGEAAPFAYTIYEGEPAEFAVSVSAYAPAETVPAQQITIERAQFVTDVLGEQHLLGQVVNAADSSVSIQTLHVAVYDADDNLLTVEDADILVRQLYAAGAPAASAPIDISLGALPAEPATYAVYADVVAAEPPTITVDISQDLYTYFDAAGDVHLVGMITNPGEGALSVEMTAGLYDAEDVLIDRSSGGLYWLRLPAGAAVPYDFTDFGLVASVPGLAERIDHYTVQIDPQYTYAEAAADVALASEGDELLADGDTWTVTGAVRNTAEPAMGRVVVIAALENADGATVAVGYDVLDSFDGAGLAADASAAYEVSLTPEPGLDPSGLTLRTYVYGAPVQ